MCSRASSNENSVQFSTVAVVYNVTQSTLYVSATSSLHSIDSLQSSRDGVSDRRQILHEFYEADVYILLESFFCKITTFSDSACSKDFCCNKFNGFQECLTESWNDKVRRLISIKWDNRAQMSLQ